MELTHNNTVITPTYGGQTVTASYDFTHTANNIKNTYTIDAEVRGIASGEPYVDWTHGTVVKRFHNNEETLTDEAVLSLIEDFKS